MAVNPPNDGGLRAVIGLAPSFYSKVTNEVDLLTDPIYEIHTFRFFVTDQGGSLRPNGVLEVRYSTATGYFASAERLS